MKFSKKGRTQVPFREVTSGDVFYSDDFSDYGMKLVPKKRDVNTVLLTDGDLVFLPNDAKVEPLEGEFVERG